MRHVAQKTVNMKEGHKGKKSGTYSTSKCLPSPNTLYSGSNAEYVPGGQNFWHKKNHKWWFSGFHILPLINATVLYTNTAATLLSPVFLKGFGKLLLQYQWSGISCVLVVCSASLYPVVLPGAFQTGNVDVVKWRSRCFLYPDTAWLTQFEV